MTAPRKTYTPEVGTVPARVVAHIQARPELFEMSSAEIAAQFGISVKNVAGALARCVHAGLLATRREGRACFYRAATGAPINWPPAPTLRTPSPAMGSPCNTRFPVSENTGPLLSRTSMTNLSTAECGMGVQIVPLAPASRANALGGTHATPRGKNAPQALDRQPDDLAAFVAGTSLREVAAALKVSRTTAHRLQAGYWPADHRAIVRAWSAYKGRAGVVASSWFLRRVRPGGLVRHAGHDFSGPHLAARTGELLAVARAAGGDLLAQTLELPPARMLLQPVARGAH